MPASIFLAIKQIEMFQADLFILSTNSISYREGIYENNLPVIELKKSFAARSQEDGTADFTGRCERKMPEPFS